MGERKVLNKYIPSDFDPKLVPRSKKPKDDLVSVRMMLPFTLQCSTCSSFMYRGRKFNSKKENVKGSEGKYLGIQRFRFYIKCTACSRPLTFLTDPENTDYEMESGGTRTLEVHKDRNKMKEDLEEQEPKSEKEDPMKALENRVLASQKEMQDLDDLDEIKAMNMRHLRMMAVARGGGANATAQILNAHHKVEEKDPLELDEGEEELIKSIKFGAKAVDKTAFVGVKISRLTDKEEQKMEKNRQKGLALMEEQQLELAAKVKKNAENQAGGGAKLNPLIKIKRKRKVKESIPLVGTTASAKKQKEEQTTLVSKPKEDALGLLAGYGTDSDSD